MRRHLIAALSALLIVGGWGCEPRRASVPEPPQATDAPAISPSEAFHLEAGATKTAWRSFADDTFHDYTLDLEAGDFLHLELEQHDVDLFSSLTAPGGEPVFAEVDLPTGDQGPEPICFVAPEPGRYRLRITPWRASEGQYRLLLVERRTARDGDAACERALRSFLDGEALKRGDRDDKLAAVERFRRAAELWTTEGTAFFRSVALRRQAQTLTVLGSGEEQILDLLLQALDVVRRTPHRAQEVNLLNDLGNHHRREDLAGAVELYEQARDLARSCGHARGEATALGNLALVDRDRGAYQRAQERFDAALEIWRRQGDERRQAEILSNLGSLLMILGEDEHAHGVLKRAFDLQRSLGDRQGEAASLLQIGWLLHLSGAETRGAELLYRALALFRAAGDGRGQAGTLDRMGTVYRELGRWRLAEESYRRALALFEESGDQRHALYTEANLGLLYEASGRGEAALAILEPVERRLAVLGDRAAHGRVLLGTAEARRSLEDFDRALEDAAAALQIFQELREQPRNPHLRTDFLAVRQDYYELYIDFLFELDRRFPDAGFAARAFRAHEEAQARTLLDLLNESGVDWRRDVPPALLDREKAILAELARADGPAEARQRDVSGRDPWQELRRLHEHMRAASPSFAALARPELVELAAVQQELDPETVLFSFRLGEERSHLWVVWRRGVESFVLPPRRAIEEQARAFHRALTESVQQRFKAQSEAYGAELYRLLFAQVPAERLAHRRWWIIADGLLHLVPFAALPEPSTGQPLVLEHELAMLPTASVWRALHKRRVERRPADRLLAVVADPVFRRNDPRLRPEASRAVIDRLSDARAKPDHPLWPSGLRRRLRHSGEEARSLLALAADEPALALVGLDARRDRVLDGALGAYRIVHFATHSRVDASRPRGSSILLSAFDRDGEPIDDLLRTEDLYGLRWSADLVVLSACSTALGRQVRGEGLMSLSRAFLQAGASGVVVSLWNVLDASTAELMERFYRALLAEGLAPAAALRQAQLEMLRIPEFEAPCFWAPFVFQGDPQWNAGSDSSIMGARRLAGLHP